MPDSKHSLRAALVTIRDLLDKCREPLRVIEKHADAGVPEAQEISRYLKSLDSAFPAKSQQMARNHKLLAEQGDAEAQFRMGVLCTVGEGVLSDRTKAAEWFYLAAVQDHAAAQSHLSHCFMNGHGVPQNFMDAVKWMRKAAENGDAIAQLALGMAHEEGRWVLQSDREAALWLHRSSEQGNPNGQFLLGKCYQSGKGVTKDLIEAHKWFNLASARNVKGAEASRDAVAKLMTLAQVIEAQSRASRFVALPGTTAQEDS